MMTYRLFFVLCMIEFFWSCSYRKNTPVIEIDNTNTQVYSSQIDSFYLDLSNASTLLHHIRIINHEFWVQDYRNKCLWRFDSCGNSLGSLKFPKSVDSMVVWVNSYDLYNGKLYLGVDDGSAVCVMDTCFNADVKRIPLRIATAHMHNTESRMEDNCPMLSGNWCSGNIFRVINDSSIVVDDSPILDDVYRKQIYCGGIINYTTGEKVKKIFSLPKSQKPINRYQYKEGGFLLSGLSYYEHHFFSWIYCEGIINEYDSSFKLLRRYHIPDDKLHPMSPYINIYGDSLTLDRKYEPYGYYNEVFDIHEKHILCRIYNCGLPTKFNILQIVDTQKEQLEYNIVLPHAEHILGYHSGILYLSEDPWHNVESQRLKVYRVSI